MGPFRGRVGQNGNKLEVEIRPVSIDDSACVHLGAKLGSGIKGQLLYHLVRIFFHGPRHATSSPSTGPRGFGARCRRSRPPAPRRFSLQHILPGAPVAPQSLPSTPGRRLRTIGIGAVLHVDVLLLDAAPEPLDQAAKRVEGERAYSGAAGARRPLHRPWPQTRHLLRPLDVLPGPREVCTQRVRCSRPRNRARACRIDGRNAEENTRDLRLWLTA